MRANKQILFVFALTLGMRCAAFGQNTSSDASAVATFRSQVSEVRVSFSASEGAQSVGTVQGSDFAVVDDGIVVRNFRSLTRSDETALEVVALVDVSESVAPRVRGAMTGVVQLVSQEERVPDDNFSVLSFGGMRPAILCAGGCGGTKAANKILSVEGSGMTPLYDGLMFAAEFMAYHHRAGARPVLILFSDGVDTISQHTTRDATQAVIESGAVIYAVDTGEPRIATPGRRFLRGIVDATGGRYFSLRDGPATVLSAVMDDLRASYVVTYEVPRRQAGFHSVHLMPTRNLNLTFHSRSGYYFENP